MATTPSSTNIIIRHRRLTGIKALDITKQSSFLFPSGEAQYDRIKAVVRANVSIPHENELPIDDLIVDRSSYGPDVFILNRRYDDNWNISIRRDRWLFGGYGQISQRAAGHIWDLVLTLELNPTRFWAHQTIHDTLAISGLSPAVALNFNAESRERIGAVTLDGNDNCLLSLQELGGSVFTSRHILWRNIIQVYVDKVEALLRVALAPPNSGIVITRFALQNFREGEIYWELNQLDSSVFVGRLARSLRQRDSGIVLVSRLEQGGEQNSEWLKLILADGIHLTIYAKTSDRIRFEISYRDGRIVDDARRYGNSQSTNNVDLLMAASDGAARRMSRIWQAIQVALNGHADAANFIQFLEILNRCVPEETRWSVLILLSTRRNIVRTDPSGILPSRICRRLVDAGLLTLTGMRSRARVYTLTPEFAAMFHHLSEE